MNSFTFQGVERIGDGLVAVFHHSAVFDYVYRGSRSYPVQRDTTRLDLPSLRQRIDNLSKAGIDTSEEEKAERELRRQIEKNTSG